MKKTRLIILMFVMASIILSGCKKGQEENNENANDQEENIETNDQEGNDPADVSYDFTYPLTGVGTNDSIDHRVISVMVNNQMVARPQSGLSQADIVFEILAEGSITRFLALFHSEQPEIVGPVRSAREYYFELAQGYDALYVYHGAANFVDEMITNRAVQHLNGAVYDNDKKLFKRETFRKAPHNSYLLYPAAFDVAQSKGYEVTKEIQSLPFLQEDEEILGDPALHVKVGYTGKNPSHIVEFTYDGQREKYLRFEDGQQTKELNSEIPIAVDNVFIIETYHEVFDDQGRRKIDITSGGSAVLIQKGKQQQVEWENRNGKIIPVKNGEPVGFVQGQTWINVVPSIEQSVQVTNE